MSQAKSAGRVLGSVKDGVAELLFDNEARRNAISVLMSEQAAEHLERFSAAPDVRVLVIRGAGDKSFISGADISEFEQVRRDAETAARYSQISSRMYSLVREFPKPTVARIRGFCFGGGMGLAAACDLRVAADDAVFAIPAARLGIAYRADFMLWLGGMIGPARLKEMLITARRYNADEALAIGLAHRVAPVASFDVFFAEYVATIAENAPLSMAASKATINAIFDTLAHVDMAQVRARADACMNSEDYAEGRRAFMEKRRPTFWGR